MATTTRPPATEEDLLRTPRDGHKYELVDGTIRMSPAGGRHGSVCVALAAVVHAFIRERALGLAFDSSTGFRFPRGNVRLPDLAFVSKDRLVDGRAPVGFVDVVPDLAVEVLSPDDRKREVLDKVGEYLEAGVRLVWVIDPGARTAAVYRSLTDVRQLGLEGVLDGEDVLPGFACPLADILD
jgi:Uma2 family endonuclease